MHATPEPFPSAFGVDYLHRILFTRDAFAPGNRVLLDALHVADDPPPRVLVIVEEGLARTQPGLTARIERWFAEQPAAPPLAGLHTLPGGETVKTGLAHVQRCWEWLHAARIDRHSCVLALGGGALLDAVGFAAATCHRGVRHVRMPSTVLGQADAGVGIKNGVNLLGAKNFVGTFAPPLAVVNDLALLDSLPDAEVRAGLAEAVKVALIRDADFFAELEAAAPALATREPGALEAAIRRTAALHVRHIVEGGDPFETGRSRPLDFGHWSAHRLEMDTGHGLRHGEAVAIGMALDLAYGIEQGWMAEADARRVWSLLTALGLPVWHEELARRDAKGRPAILQGARDFQEHIGGRLTLTMLHGIGQAVDVHELDEAKLTAAVERLRKISP